jgi:hypothetical protein
VPNGKGATLIQLLVDHGFSLVRSLVASCYDSVVTSRYVMIRDGGEKRVNVLEATGKSTLGVVLRSPCTALMVAINPSYVYTFYPSSTFAGRALRGTVPISEEDATKYKQRGLDVQEGCDTWRAQCGALCPNIYRTVRGKSGVTKTRWSVSASSASCLKEQSYKWTLGRACRNPWCDYSEPNIRNT